MTLSTSWATPWVAIALSVLGGAGCHDAEAADPRGASPGGSSSTASQLSGATVEGAEPVELGEVGAGPVARPIVAGATLRARRDYELSFQVGGVVRAVTVDVGARVKRGQLLAAIDPTPTTAALRQAEESLDRARREAARAELLGRAGALPIAQLEDARSAAVLADASVAMARFSARHTALVAPEDGVIDQRAVEVGEVVAPGRPAFVLSGRAEGFVVVADLADRDAVDVAVGDPAQLELDALPGAPIEAKVARVAQSAARGTGTFEVELSIVAPARPLLSGLTGRVHIARDVPVAATVPLGALVDADAEAGAVFVVEGARARRVPVQIAFLAGDRAALRAWQGPDRVVVRGAERLRDGAAVEVRAPEARR